MSKNIPKTISKHDYGTPQISINSSLKHKNLIDMNSRSNSNINQLDLKKKLLSAQIIDQDIDQLPNETGAKSAKNGIGS